MWSIDTIKRMNADEVRRRTEEAKRTTPHIRDLVERVDKCIQSAADKGEMALTKNPLAGLHRIITAEEARAVWAEFRGRGFKVTIRADRFSLGWK